MPEINTTFDAVGDIIICQPEKGFRFSTDALLLYLSLKSCDYTHILDIGAGSGIVSFLCAQRYPDAQITSVELHDEMYSCLLKGIERNGFSHRIHALHTDIGDCDAYRHHPFDCIVCNPPYRAAGSGQESPYSSKNTAIYDTTLPPEKLFKAIKRNSTITTDIAVCYIHERHTTYLYAALAYGIYPQTIISYIQGSGAMITVTLFSLTQHVSPEHRFVVESKWKSEIDLLFKGG